MRLGVPTHNRGQPALTFQLLGAGGAFLDSFDQTFYVDCRDNRPLVLEGNVDPALFDLIMRVHFYSKSAWDMDRC
jgi:hypothetical protein